MTAAGTTPLAWTFGLDPMMLKEFLGLNRRWQTYLFRALYVGILGLAAWYAWRRLSAGSAWISYTDYSRFGRRLFETLGQAQLILTAILGLVTGSDMVSKEVRARTLGLLALTPMPSGRIAFGMWKSCMGFQTLVFLSGLPLMAMGIYTGGVSPEDFIAIILMGLSLGAVCAALSITYSAYFRQPYMTLLACLLTLGLVVLTPLSCFLSYFNFLNVGRLSTGLVSSSIMSCIVSVFVTWILLTVTAGKIASLAGASAAYSPVPAVRGPWTPNEGAVGTRWLQDLAVREGVWDFSPCLWRELRTGTTYGARRISLASLAIAGVLSPFFLFHTSIYGMTNLLSVLLGLATLTGVAAGAGAFAGDMEEKRWDVLLVTPVSPLQIVAAKFLAAAASALPQMIALLVISLLAMRVVSLGRLAPLVAAMIAFPFFAVAISLFISLVARNTHRAMAFALTAVAFPMSFLPAITAVLSDADFFDWRRSNMDFLVRATNPFWQLAILGRHSWGGPNDGAVYILPVLYLLLGVLALAVCILGFNRLAGRGR